MVADELSHKVGHGISLTRVVKLEVAPDLMRLGIELVLSDRTKLYLSSISNQPTLLDEIKYTYLGGPKIEGIKVNIRKEKLLGFYEDDKVVIRFQGRVCVLQKLRLSAKIPFEAHNTLYSVHLGGMKIYKDLR